MSQERATTAQRADYTYKHNAGRGRHDWLRLTPAYSVKLVRELLSTQKGNPRVLDPFAGTSTTALCASEFGYSAQTVDLNPFLIWLGKAKTASYSRSDIAAAEQHAEQVLKRVRDASITPAPVPPLHNIERWWEPSALLFLRRLRAGIDELSRKKAAHNLLRIAFCRTLISISNAAFNHQSMSFKDTDKQLPLPDFLALVAGHERQFLTDLKHVLSTASLNPGGDVTVLDGDARQLHESVSGRFDLLITSPPYVNRMSYIRELRPYMYWLGFLETAREAGELDWKAIGGTWGIATSRLLDWQTSSDTYCPDYLASTIEAIERDGGKNGPLLATYVEKYFADMWQHFRSAAKVMKPGGELHYIVGNSTFFGHTVHAERVYADMLKAVGFDAVHITTVRKRNSNKALFEFDVSARA